MKVLSYVENNYDINKDKRYSNDIGEISTMSYCIGLNNFVDTRNNATKNMEVFRLAYLYDDENNLLFKNKKIVESFNKLNPNWNGCGGLKIDQQSINLVSNLLSYLNKQPDIFPTGRGTIHLEYDFAEKRYLEFEVYSDRIHIFYDIDDDFHNEDIQFIKNVSSEALPILLCRKLNRIISLVYGK